MTMAGKNAPSLSRSQLDRVFLNSASSRHSWLKIGSRVTLSSFSTLLPAAMTAVVVKPPRHGAGCVCDDQWPGDATACRGVRAAELRKATL